MHDEINENYLEGPLTFSHPSPDKNRPMTVHDIKVRGFSGYGKRKVKVRTVAETLMNSQEGL